MPGVIHIRPFQGFEEKKVECFCVLPQAMPGVIHIKPFQGFEEKKCRRILL
jgi:hypothetical protein